MIPQVDVQIIGNKARITHTFVIPDDTDIIEGSAQALAYFDPIRQSRLEQGAVQEPSRPCFFLCGSMARTREFAKANLPDGVPQFHISTPQGLRGHTLEYGVDRVLYLGGWSEATVTELLREVLVAGLAKADDSGKQVTVEFL